MIQRCICEISDGKYRTIAELQEPTIKMCESEICLFSRWVLVNNYVTTNVTPWIIYVSKYYWGWNRTLVRYMTWFYVISHQEK